MTAKQGSLKIAFPMTLLSVIIALVGSLLFLTEFAFAEPLFVLSPDGYAVVRLTPEGTVGASTLNTALLTPGFTSATGTGGSLSVTSYTAAFASGMGGAEIKALYDRGGPLSAGQSLEWVQVITTNAPLGGATSPYLDNAGKPSAPFYTFTAENRDPTLPANKLNFYDFSKRDPATLTTLNPITWNANLYPVISDGAKGITVQDGVSWGWSMKKAMVGSDSGVFVNPAPATAVTSGVGTNIFRWGSGDPSSLSFIGESFDTEPNTPFKLGHLTFHNGVIASGTGADSVTLDVLMSFDNVPEKNSVFPINFHMINTLNTDDPIASADTVGIDGFSFTFNVLEGATASADIIAMLSTNLSALPSGAVPTGAELFSTRPFDPSGNYSLSIVGFADPSTGGFIGGSVPEPSTLLLVSLGLIAALTVRRRLRQ